MNSNPPPSLIRHLRLLLVIAVGIAIVYIGLRKVNSPPVALVNKQVDFKATTNVATPVVLPVAMPPVAATNLIRQSAPSRLPVPQFAWFRDHPFAATETNGGFAWTIEDGRETNVIRQLAHNELEYQRMVNENGSIYRRQLVYFVEGLTLRAQQAVQTGRSFRQVTLPGLDGQELSVQVTKSDFESGGDKGLIYGKLPDDPNSMVTAAFVNGREAFTVVSPQNHLYLLGESREPGEIVVKSIDPSNYGVDHGD